VSAGLDTCDGISVVLAGAVVLAEAGCAIGSEVVDASIAASEDSDESEPLIARAEMGSVVITTTAVSAQKTRQVRHNLRGSRSNCRPREHPILAVALFERPQVFMLLDASFVDQFAEMGAHRLSGRRVQEFRYVGVNLFDDGHYFQRAAS
jgi:hypothetical protein